MQNDASSFSLESIRLMASVCTECELSAGRINSVFDKGNPTSSIFICGMVPAEEENKQGLPFVGRAGKLLDQILEDVGLTLDGVYITNLVKCFLAPGKPLQPEWISSCIPFLLAQLELIRPRVIIALGRDASFALLPGSENKSMGELRKEPHVFQSHIIVPTYHPSFLLRKGGGKGTNVYYQQTLEDFKRASHACANKELKRN